MTPNKELERTRSAQTAVGPCRSIPCWTDARRGGLHDRDSGILPLSSVTQEES